MTPGTIGALLEAHAGRATGSPKGTAAEGELALTPDHAVITERAGQLVLPALRRLPVDRVRIALVLLCADPRRTPGSLEAAGPVADLLEAARALGFHVAPPGTGHAEAVYFDRCAAPARLVLASGESVAAAGALGTLAFECGELELAAVLAGGTLHRPVPESIGVVLRGTLPPGLSGLDAALEVGRRLGPGGARGRLIEVSGPGVASLDISERVAFVTTCAELGAAAALFPSDEVTRVHLRARGRDSDWKRLDPEPPAPGGRSVEIDLEGLEPSAAEPGRLEQGRVLGERPGPEIRRVVFGPRATADDLERLAARLAGPGLHPGVALDVLPGSRERLEQVSVSGALETLRRAGARIVESGIVPPGAAVAGAAEAGLCFGARARDLPELKLSWWIASAESCAAAALTGRLTDPRTMAAARGGRAEGEAIASPGPPRLLAPLGAPVAPAAAVAGSTGIPLAAAISGVLRGVVLIRAGDDASSGQVLPWGARLEPHAGDIGSLADHAFAPLDPNFARRARAHGGGFVVAGERLGHGPARAQAALVLVALGVRAAIARSFSRSFLRELVQAGVLPLRFTRPADFERLGSGDELELPTLPEGLEPGRALVVRNLTRGTQFIVAHDLGAREIAVVRAGGLLPFAAGMLAGPGATGAAALSAVAG